MIFKSKWINRFNSPNISNYCSAGSCSADRAQRGPYKTTEGQYSPVRLEQSRLVSNLLHTALGQNLFILSINSLSGLFNSKGFRRDMFLMTRATKKDQAATSLKTNSFSVKSQETVFILSSETEM